MGKRFKCLGWIESSRPGISEDKTVSGVTDLVGHSQSG